MKTKRVLFWSILVLPLIFLLVGCQQYTAMPIQPSGTSDQQNNPATSDIQKPDAKSVVTTANTGLGQIVTGKNGMTLYIFEADKGGESTCYNACATNWPPLLTDNKAQVTGEGVTAKLGVTERSDGEIQVTANGYPLYFFIKDEEPGDTNGQGVLGGGALWYVLSPSGRVIKTAQNACVRDSDCATDACCHPSGCVRKVERVCNQLCTSNCEGPLDCGNGSCGCVNNRCTIIPAALTTGETYYVDITNFAFRMASLAINVGDSVVWTNTDSAPHSVTSDSGMELNSAQLAKGESYSHTFNTEGTFNYHCSLHSNMRGKIVVGNDIAGP